MDLRTQHARSFSLLTRFWRITRLNEAAKSFFKKKILAFELDQRMWFRDGLRLAVDDPLV